MIKGVITTVGAIHAIQGGFVVTLTTRAAVTVEIVPANMFVR